MTKSWILYRGAQVRDFGFIPSFFDEDDPRPLREQIGEAYGFAGGSLGAQTVDRSEQTHG